jgi:hypothetical protein
MQGKSIISNTTDEENSIAKTAPASGVPNTEPKPPATAEIIKIFLSDAESLNGLLNWSAIALPFVKRCLHVLPNHQKNG